MLEESKASEEATMTREVLDRPPVHALLADGTTVCIRAVRQEDHQRLRGFYEAMSPENLRLRFFAVNRHSAATAADRACAPARPGYRVLLAETQGRVIGFAEYDTGGERDTAEISVAVAGGTAAPVADGERLPQLAEADLDPVLATPGTVTLDARVRLLPRRAHDPYLRRLR
jgi:hypothetical protein